MIPLIKQLIALLESGMQFQLSPDMLSVLRQPHSAQQQVIALVLFPCLFSAHQKTRVVIVFFIALLGMDCLQLGAFARRT